MLLHSFNPPLLLKQHVKIGSIIHSAYQIFNKCEREQQINKVIVCDTRRKYHSLFIFTT